MPKPTWLRNCLAAVAVVLGVFECAVLADDPFGSGGANSKPTNLRLFLSSDRLQAWFSRPIQSDFQETFTLQGKSHPAHGTSSTTAKLVNNRVTQDNQLQLELVSQVSTRLLPQTPIGRIFVDAKSTVTSPVHIWLLNDRLMVQSGCPAICSRVVGDGICTNTTGKVGLRLKRKIVGAVVDAKNDDILQRLNDKIIDNLKKELEQESQKAVFKVNDSLQNFQTDLRKNGVQCIFHTRNTPGGLMFGANLSSTVRPVDASERVGDFKAPAGCWVAFHESAINNLQPILDNQTIDAQAFRKMWTERFLLGKELGQAAIGTVPTLSKIGNTPLAKSAKVAFAKPAVTTRFLEDQLLLSMRIAALANQATVVQLEPPLTVDAIYDIANQDGTMQLRLDESSLEEIQLDRRKLLEQFLPKVIEYTGDQLESVLETELGIKLGRPTADSGWLVIPFQDSVNRVDGQL